MPPTLYVCDLDGTLLGPDARLSKFARDGLNRLLGAGVWLTLASSRRTVSTRALFAGVELRLPVIEVNGAFVSELTSGRHLAANVLPPPFAAAAIHALGATGSDPVLTAKDGSVYFGPRANAGASWYMEEKRAYGDSELIPCDDLPGVAKRAQIAAITGFVADAEGPALTARLEGLLGESAIVYSAFNYYVPGWTEVQIQHPLAEKGAAAPALLRACGTEGAQVIACGDHLNDLGLFTVADHRIAPANAHPAILERADEVVAGNDEDGVVRHLLARHGLG